MKALLNHILSAEHLKVGLRLTEDEDFVYLWKGTVLAAVFSAQGVTFSSIHDVANKYLCGDAVEELAKCGGVSFR